MSQYMHIALTWAVSLRVLSSASQYCVSMLKQHGLSKGDKIGESIAINTV